VDTTFDNTLTTLCSLTLPVGVWLLNVQARGYCDVSTSPTSYYSIYSGATSIFFGSVSFLTYVDITSNGMICYNNTATNTIYFKAQSTTTDNITYRSTSYLQATRIA